MTTMQATDHDLEQVELLAGDLQITVQELREEVYKVTNPQVKLLFETSAEVISGLLMTFHNYVKGTSAARAQA